MSNQLNPMTDEEIEEELRQLNELEDGDETVEHADTQYSDYPESDIQSIAIQYDNDEFAMYGINGTEGIDTAASEAKFEQMLEAELAKNYPDVEIIIETGYGRYMVDGDTAHPEVDAVSQILHNVWSSFEWVVENAN